MMNWQEEKDLMRKRVKLSDEYFSLQEKMVFAKELAMLCRASDNYTASALRVDRYEEQDYQDKKTLLELNEELLIDEVDFYSAFVEFVKKFGNYTRAECLKFFLENERSDSAKSYNEYIQEVFRNDKSE